MKDKQTFAEAGYRYVRYDKETGLHILEDTEARKLELFRATVSPHSGWGLYSRARRRYFEFIRSKD
ncbi:MAG: hypothetical protein EPO41_04005 [Reyranella sp.]|uniref:hypothetical protein n=1 Tax=Reyranella sp. TaxID=1929291 RepID=UPI0012137D9D|nr:hypothetical protein [Reyranella sp.]TAJ97165.1 MAG: hypothetical protein EPO41_04005 [Reyranella sp.]